MKRPILIVLAVILALGGVVGLMLAYSGPAAAATLTVTTNSDAGDDATFGADLAADLADGAGLSLREAIHWAASGDTIEFHGGLSGQTITLGGIQLTIDKDITLDGDLDDDGAPDITISGNSTSRVIYTTGLTVAARLEGLTIRDGGNVTDGGGMYNFSSSPTITGCTFSGNGAAAWGGGMYNTASSPTITNCTFSGNTITVNGDGGGMGNWNGSSPTITGCTFSGNTARYGSGMHNVTSSPTITSCTFSGNTGNGGSGMHNMTSSPTITSCTFIGNIATTHPGGGMNNTSSSPTITNCIFSGNTASRGGGMYNHNLPPPNPPSSPTITNCIFSGNTATSVDGGGGIWSDPLCVITATNCIFWGNSNGELSGFPPYSVSYSDVQGGYAGTGNFNKDPLFAGGGDYHLKSAGGRWTQSGWVQDTVHSPCIDAGDPASSYANEPSPNGGRINMGAYGNTAQASKRFSAVYVNDDVMDGTEQWCTAVGNDANSGLSPNVPKRTIQAVIDTYDLEPGDIVYIDAGTYMENIVIGAADDGATFLGSGAATCTIDGNNSGTVITATGLTAAARLEGFTITNGSAPDGGGMFNSGSSPTITSCTFSNNTAGDWGGGMYSDGTSSPNIIGCTFNGNAADYGGGIFNDNGSSPVITSCVFNGNTASNEGGGICNNVSLGTITDCVFNGNTASNEGGGMYNTGSSPAVTGCIFSGNSANYGGGMGNADSSPTVTDCTFSSNSATSMGGGMYNRVGSSPSVANCTFSNNSAISGGGMSNESSSPTISNCVLSSNAATYGGGMYNAFSSPTITNCTFSGNSASGNGGGMTNELSSFPIITNCIFWADAGGEFANFSIPVVTYSDVEGGYTGTGNINKNPLFVGGGDFHLQSQGGHWTAAGWVMDAQTSPCIDAGDPASAFGNEPAPNGGRINMGAYGNTVQASKSAPEMDVSGNGNSIADGDTTPSTTDQTDFGTVDIYTGTVDHTFTITNFGGIALNLTGTPIVVVGGAHASDFTVIAQPGTPVASGGGTTTFTVRFDPSAEGLRTATLSIANNDANENPYNFTIQGTGFIPPPIITSFTPTSAAIGASVTITGTNFTGATSVKFGGTEASSFTVDSATQITAVVGSGSSGNVTVTTPGGTASRSGFTYTFYYPTYYPSDINLLGTRLNFFTDYSGKLQQTIDITSPDGTLQLHIPQGTLVKSKSGLPLTYLNIVVYETPPPPPPDCCIIGLPFDFKPDGATFDPPITFTFTYDPETLCEGVAEEDLVLAFYDEDTGSWIELDCVVDTENHTITASVSHFTCFAIIGRVVLPAEFSVSNLSVQPVEAKPGEAATITVTVTNTGGREGIYIAVLEINGVREKTQAITLAAGTTLEATFTVSREEPGNYTVQINGLEGSFTVISPPAPPSPPPPASQPAQQAPQPTTSPPAPTEEGEMNWWLIGGIIGGCIVILLLVLLIRRTTP